MLDRMATAKKHVDLILDIDMGLCTPGCVAATHPRHNCQCICRGRNHGKAWLVNPIDAKEGKAA